MKVTLLVDCKHGPAGKTVSGAECWRLCFPIKGCVAKAVDDEAVAAVLTELGTFSGDSRKWLEDKMSGAGTLPEQKPAEKPATAPSKTPKKGTVTEIPPPHSHKSKASDVLPQSSIGVVPDRTESSGKGD